MKMISKWRPQNYWPWWIFNEERSVEHGNMALVFSHGKTVYPQAEDEISRQAQQIKESIALNPVRSQNPSTFPTTVCLWEASARKILSF